MRTASRPPVPLRGRSRSSRPDICIGTDPFHTPPALSTLQLPCAGSRLDNNDRSPIFSGRLSRILLSIVVMQKVQSLMIEVNRSRYMDETTGARGAGFESCRAWIGRLISAIVSQHGAR